MRWGRDKWVCLCSALLVIAVLSGGKEAFAAVAAAGLEKGQIYKLDRDTRVVLPPLAELGRLAETEKSEQDYSWWPNKAVPQPVKDKTRRGYWWWPKERGEATSEAWGNRGIVYRIWSPPVEEEPSGVAPAPLAEPEPVQEEPQPQVVEETEPMQEVTPPEPAPAPAPPPIVVKKKITLPEVYFFFDSFRMKQGAEERIQEVVEYMRENPDERVIIEGHTCSLGTEEYNYQLGLRRARAAARELGQRGISSERIGTVSYGETRPEYPNDTPEHRALNRRVVFKIGPDEE